VRALRRDVSDRSPVSGALQRLSMAMTKEVLEALAFGKSSRISNRPAMVYAFTVVAWSRSKQGFRFPHVRREITPSWPPWNAV
jgi:hypothetical protein